MSRRVDLDTVLRFGRHAGRTVEDVLNGADGGEPDPGWLRWAIENGAIETDDALHDEIMREARGSR